MFNQFWEYFMRVTNGKYANMCQFVGQALNQADMIFGQRNNGVMIGFRPDLHEEYARIAEDCLRNMGAPIDLEREVGNRLNEYFRLNR